MVERICPSCQHANPLDDTYCGRCGQKLVQQLPAHRDQQLPAVLSQNLPIPWRDVGRSLALGAVALVAEAGMSYLRNRIARLGQAPVSSPATPTSLIRAASDTVTIVSERVLEIWDHGGMTRQVVEKTVWRRTHE